ncbi:MAG: AarF/ABC1/UbiB kinase family protein, partial [Cyanobacteria bacterium P01_H01_bin.121]
MFSLAKTSARQREILEVVFRNGWDFMRQLLSGSRAEKPELPPPQVLRNILVELGPVYVKLGQLLSTRPDLLPPPYIESLSSLQAKVPAVAWPEIEITIRQQLTRPWNEVFAMVEPEPIAAGSIAQTHRARLQSGELVALKVQRPGIAQVVAQDIALIRALAELAALTDFGQDYDAIALAEEFAEALQAELDFTDEARSTDQLRRNLSTSRWFDPKAINVPLVYWELVTEKLLVLEWLDGSPILVATALQGADQAKTRQDVASLLVRSFFQQVCLDGFFHADPHPGNLFYLRDRRVALLDCGMVGRLDPRTQEILLELILGVVSLDAQRCAQLTLKLSPPERSVNLIQLENDFDRLLRQYYSLDLNELNFSELFYEVLQTARDNKIRIPGNLGLVAKAIANLEGVARTLDPTFNFPQQIRPLMAQVFQQQLVGDAPLPAILRTFLDLKGLGLRSPRQVELLLDRLSSETLQFNLRSQDAEKFRISFERVGNRLAFSIVA